MAKGLDVPLSHIIMVMLLLPQYISYIEEEVEERKLLNKC